MEERDERERERFPAEPDEFEDEETEEVDEPRGSRRGLGLILLGAVLVAAVVIAVPYLRGWWSRPLPPPSPPQVTKSEPTPPTPVIPAEVAKAVPQEAVAPRPAPAAPAERTVTPAPTPFKGEFWVQVGAFANPNNAQRLSDRLTAEHYSVVVRPSESSTGLVVVRVGAYPDRRQAEAIRADLEKKGFAGFVLREKRP